jgi:aspartate ammonia-lyase
MITNLIGNGIATTAVANVFTEYCLSGIEANEDKLANDVERSVGIITAVNPHLGYKADARIAREAILSGQSNPYGNYA